MWYWFGAGLVLLSIGIGLLTTDRSFSLYVGIPIVLLSFLLFYVFGKSYLFIRRVITYIGEGQILLDKSNIDTYTTSKYLQSMLDWATRVEEDIHRNKGQSAVIIFQDLQNTQPLLGLLPGDSEGMKRYHISQIIGFRLERLKELQKRL